MAREILRGHSDEGRANYQLAITTCDHCAQGFQQAAGELLPVEPEIVEMARCDAQELGNVSEPHVGAHATQSVPPALRRQVMRRDHGRCVVPGCSHGTFLDVHHLDLRSEGGAHTFDNLVALCSARHRAMHLGQLMIEGTPSTALAFRHADGSTYGSAPSADRADMVQKVFRALTGQGFSEKQVREVLPRVLVDTTESQTCEQVLRASLRCLTERATARPGRVRRIPSSPRSG